MDFISTCNIEVMFLIAPFRISRNKLHGIYYPKPPNSNSSFQSLLKFIIGTFHAYIDLTLKIHATGLFSIIFFTDHTLFGYFCISNFRQRLSLLLKMFCKSSCSVSALINFVKCCNLSSEFICILH